MLVDNLYCVRMLANINSRKHSAQCTEGVISNLLYFNLVMPFYGILNIQVFWEGFCITG